MNYVKFTRFFLSGCTDTWFLDESCVPLVLDNPLSSTVTEKSLAMKKIGTYQVRYCAWDQLLYTEQGQSKAIGLALSSVCHEWWKNLLNPPLTVNVSMHNNAVDVHVHCGEGILWQMMHVSYHLLGRKYLLLRRDFSVIISLWGTVHLEHGAALWPWSPKPDILHMAGWSQTMPSRTTLTSIPLGLLGVM